MKVVDLVCTFIGVYTDVIVLYMFLTQYEINGSKIGKISLFAGFGLINILMNVLEVPFMLKLSISIISCVIIIMLLCADVTWFGSIRCTITFYTLLGIGELFVIPIMILFEGIYDIDLFYSETITSIWVLTLVLSRIITIVFIKIMGKFLYRNENKTTIIEKLLIYSPLALAFSSDIIVEHYLINIEQFDMEDITSVLIILAIILMAFTITYIKFLERSILARQQEKQIIELEHRNEMQYMLYEERNKYGNEIKRIRHDLKNHLLLVKDNNEIKNTVYYDELLDIVENDEVISSGCNVFDVLINEKKKIAEGSGITFAVLVVKDIACLNYIKERDLCSIFGNIIDNAIESAAGMVNASVEVKTDVINSFFYMYVKNTFNNKKIRTVGGHFFTTKQDRSIHGIGLNSVKIALEKYDGCMKIDYDDTTFEVEIMIPLQTK